MEVEKHNFSLLLPSYDLNKDPHLAGARHFVDHLAMANNRLRLLNLQVKRMTPQQFLKEWDECFEATHTHLPRKFSDYSVPPSSHSFSHSQLQMQIEDQHSLLLLAHHEISKPTIENECQIVASLLDRFYEKLSNRLDILQEYGRQHGITSALDCLAYSKFLPSPELMVPPTEPENSPTPLSFPTSSVEDFAQIDNNSLESLVNGTQDGLKAMETFFDQFSFDEKGNCEAFIDLLKIELGKVVNCAENLASEFLRVVPRRVTLHETLVAKSKLLGPGPSGLKRRKKKGFEILQKYESHVMEVLNRIRECVNGIVECFHNILLPGYSSYIMRSI